MPSAGKSKLPEAKLSEADEAEVAKVNLNSDHFCESFSSFFVFCSCWLEFDQLKPNKFMCFLLYFSFFLYMYFLLLLLLLWYEERMQNYFCSAAGLSATFAGDLLSFAINGALCFCASSYCFLNAFASKNITICQYYRYRKRRKEKQKQNARQFKNIF